MFDLKDLNKIFIDFDGVIVNSNQFKENAIQSTIFELYGEKEITLKAINFFNENAGISRRIKLSLFFKDDQVNKIMKIYSEKCNLFFNDAKPTKGVKKFLEYIKKENKNAKIYILSGGEKKEIKFFLEKNYLFSFFEDILSSEKSKIEHLESKKASKNDIFIGDSKNDLKAALSLGIKFILFEEYKSLKSFPEAKIISKNDLFKTQNFESLLNTFLL